MNNIIKKITAAKTLVSLTAVLFAAMFLISSPGCDENGGITIPSGATNLGLSLKAVDNLSDDPPAVIVITSAKTLISRVEFEVEGKTTTQQIGVGTTAVNLSVDGSLKQGLNGYIIRDNYTKIKMQVHKPDDSETPPDAEFKEGTGVNQRYSFIIKGTYNGVPFVYKSLVSFQVIINFPQTVNINLPTMNVTVIFDKLKWFKSGATVLNPSDPNNAALIDDNIKNSFRQVFKDDNSDGNPDN